MVWGHIEKPTQLYFQHNFNAETVFFFALSLVTVFDFELLCDIQIRP